MKKASDGSLVVVGPGERLEELSAALGGLLGRASGVRLVALGDLAQLLLLPAPSGRLLLDGDRVPQEDIGILRRFLEGRTGWSLAVIGEDPGGGVCPALLELGGSHFVAWPPNLDQLRALAAPTDAGEPLEDYVLPSAAPQAAAPPPAPEANPTPAPEPNGEPASWDLTGLLDDLLVGRSVSEGAAAYAFGPSGAVQLACPRAEVSDLLDGFLALAEACAGAGNEVEVKASSEAGEAVVEILFPPGELTDGDLPVLLQDGPFEGPRALREAAESARAANLVAQELSGRASVGPSRPGQLRLEVRLPLQG